MSREVLYVPFYLRSFSIGEKMILTFLIFVSAIAISSIPLVLSSTQTSEATTTKTYTNEAELWKTLGEK